MPYRIGRMMREKVCWPANQADGIRGQADMFHAAAFNRILIPLLAMLLTACAATNSGNEGSTKPDKKLFKGTWQVTDIRFVGDEGLYKANLFDIADSACFKGSEWVFIPNNGAGRFSLSSSASQCSASSHRILWSIYQSEEGSYQHCLGHIVKTVSLEKPQ